VVKKGTRKQAKKKVLTLFGTRPEMIKLAPVIRELEAQDRIFQTVNAASAQHTDLLYPFARLFDIRIDHDLGIMTANQTPNQICARILSALDILLAREQPDLILVQGDTTTTLAGALAGFHWRLPVGHVEAGLRSGNLFSPYPEEMNRRLVSRLATYHFAATPHNRETLLSEGILPENIFITGNPVIDALESIRQCFRKVPAVDALLAETSGLKRIVLTTHRRESFGPEMHGNLQVLRRFIEERKDVALLFPVHPNPEVRRQATEVLSGHRRIYLLSPLEYPEFIMLLSHAWLIVSDSGGVQEEAPTLGKPVLILRENTERPEAIGAGVARLVGGAPEQLAAMLEEAYTPHSWVADMTARDNPFGKGDSGKRIVKIVATLLGVVDPDRVSTSEARESML